MKLIPNSAGFSESNSCHTPSGPGGGQFCSGTGSGGSVFGAPYKPLMGREAVLAAGRAAADLVKTPSGRTKLAKSVAAARLATQAAHAAWQSDKQPGAAETLKAFRAAQDRQDEIELPLGHLKDTPNARKVRASVNDMMKRRGMEPDDTDLELRGERTVARRKRRVTRNRNKSRMDAMYGKGDW